MFKIDEALANGDNLWTYNKETQSVDFAYRSDIENEYKELFSAIFTGINLDESTAQGQIITSLTQMDLNQLNTLSNIANAFFFGGSGIFLDMWAFNQYRLTRKRGVKSQVIIKIQGSAGTAIPETFKVSDGEHYYTIASADTIPTGGEVECLFIADKLEDFQAPANSIIKITRVVVGIDRVINPAKATEPIMAETDSQLYDRAIKYGAATKNSTFKTMMASLANINGVTKLSGGENYTSASKTIKGVQLKPHSVFVIVKGGTDTEIAQCLRDTRPPGCDMNGDVVVNLVVDESEYQYTFSRPSIVDLKAEVTISYDNLATADYPTMTKNALESFINGLDMAELISQPQLSQALRDQIKLFDIIDLKFGLKNGELGYTPIQLKLNEEVLISADDIEIKVQA